jgi:hypothetical protein
VTGDELTALMWLELSALAEDRWTAIRRAVAARIAADCWPSWTGRRHRPVGCIGNGK